MRGNARSSLLPEWLTQMKVELSQAVAELETALLERVRSRLMQQVDTMASATSPHLPASHTISPADIHDAAGSQGSATIRIGTAVKFEPWQLLQFVLIRILRRGQSGPHSRPIRV